MYFFYSFHFYVSVHTLLHWRSFFLHLSNIQPFSTFVCKEAIITSYFKYCFYSFLLQPDISYTNPAKCSCCLHCIAHYDIIYQKDQINAYTNCSYLNMMMKDVQIHEHTEKLKTFLLCEMSIKNHIFLHVLYLLVLV